MTHENSKDNSFTRVERALLLRPEIAARARERMKAGLKLGTEMPQATQQIERGQTDELIAQHAGVSRGLLRQVLHVLKRGTPDVIDAARTGLITTNRAAQLIRAQEIADYMGMLIDRDKNRFLRIWNDHPGHAGFVYVLSSPIGAYKIGRALDPFSRAATIGTELPFDVQVEVLFVVSSALELEKGLHKHYADKRMKGEWFALTSDDVEHLRKLANGIISYEQMLKEKRKW